VIVVFMGACSPRSGAYRGFNVTTRIGGKTPHVSKTLRNNIISGAVERPAGAFLQEFASASACIGTMRQRHGRAGWRRVRANGQRGCDGRYTKMRSARWFLDVIASGASGGRWARRRASSCSSPLSFHVVCRRSAAGQIEQPPAVRRWERRRDIAARFALPSIRAFIGGGDSTTSRTSTATADVGANPLGEHREPPAGGTACAVNDQRRSPKGQRLETPRSTISSAVRGLGIWRRVCPRPVPEF
jgi:hypothetical protein